MVIRDAYRNGAFIFLYFGLTNKKSMNIKKVTSVNLFHKERKIPPFVSIKMVEFMNLRITKIPLMDFTLFHVI